MSSSHAKAYFHPQEDDENFLLSPVDHVSFERVDGSVVSNETRPFWREGSGDETVELGNEFNNDVIIFIENIQDVQFNKRSVRTQYTKNLKGRRSHREHNTPKDLLHPLHDDRGGDDDDAEEEFSASFAEGTNSTLFGHSFAGSSRHTGKKPKSVLKNPKRGRTKPKKEKRRTASIGDTRLYPDSDLRNALDVGEFYYTSNRGGDGVGGGGSVASSIDSGSENPAGASVSTHQSTGIGGSVISDLTEANRSYYDRGSQQPLPSDIQSICSSSSFASLNKHRTSPPGGFKTGITVHPPPSTATSIYQNPSANFFRPAPDTILERSERSDSGTSFRGSRYNPEKVKRSLNPKHFAAGETSSSTVDTHDLTAPSVQSVLDSNDGTTTNNDNIDSSLHPEDVFAHVSGLEIEFDVHGEKRKGWYTGMIVRGNSKEVPHDELGHLEFHNGDLYDGPFHYGFMQGPNATFQWKQGDVYRGDMYLNMRHGEGEYITVNRRRYVGSYKKDVPHGHGILYNSDKTIFHLGQWYKGRPNEEDAASSHYNRSHATPHTSSSGKKKKHHRSRKGHRKSKKKSLSSTTASATIPPSAATSIYDRSATLVA